MAMTAAVKDELARLPVTKPCCRKAEIASLLRFAGGLHLNGGHLLVEAELDAGATARRLRKDLAEIYGHASEMAVVSGAGIRKGSRYLVRVNKDGDAPAKDLSITLRGTILDQQIAATDRDYAARREGGAVGAASQDWHTEAAG